MFCGSIPGNKSLAVITVTVHVVCDTGRTEAEISFVVFCMLFRNRSPKAQGGPCGFVAGLLTQRKEFCSFEAEVRKSTSVSEISVHGSFGARG